MNEEKKIVVRAIVRMFIMIGLILAVLLVGAGSWDWPMAYIFIGMYLGYFVVLFAWGQKNDKQGVLAERAKSLDQEDAAPWDKKILTVYILLTFVLYISAGLDRRFAWSDVPLWLKLLGVAGYLTSAAISFRVVTLNPFASGTVRIQEERDHYVIDSGPYRYIRHPMYTAALFFSWGMPLLLGSYWALIPGLTIIPLFMLRTWLEDNYLQENLPGYKEYVGRVKYRLIPGVW